MPRSRARAGDGRRVASSRCGRCDRCRPVAQPSLVKATEAAKQYLVSDTARSFADATVFTRTGSLSAVTASAASVRRSSGRSTAVVPYLLISSISRSSECRDPAGPYRTLRFDAVVSIPSATLADRGRVRPFVCRAGRRSVDRAPEDANHGAAEEISAEAAKRAEHSRCLRALGVSASSEACSWLTTFSIAAPRSAKRAGCSVPRVSIR